MIKQKLISVKIDEDLLPLLDSLAEEYGCKRNRLINLAVSLKCDNMLNFHSKFNLVSVYSKEITNVNVYIL